MAKTARRTLHEESRRFADWLGTLLNGTVTNGIRLDWNLNKLQPWATVKSKDRPLPLSISTRKPSAHLVLGYMLGLDRTDRFLTVRSSFVGLSRDAAQTERLLHYDYERGKPDGYPEAHVQVYAHPSTVATTGRSRPHHGCRRSAIERQGVSQPQVASF